MAGNTWKMVHGLDREVISHVDINAQVWIFYSPKVCLKKWLRSDSTVNWSDSRAQKKQRNDQIHHGYRVSENLVNTEATDVSIYGLILQPLL